MTAPTFLCGGVEECGTGNPSPTMGTAAGMDCKRIAKVLTFSANVWTKNIFIGKRLDFSPIETDEIICYY